MFACANPVQVGVRILLSHLTAGHRRDHSFLGMPCPHGSHGCVELRCACSCSQSCSFIRRELAAFDHLVELLEDAYLVHISSPRSGIGLWSLLIPPRGIWPRYQLAQREDRGIHVVAGALESGSAVGRCGRCGSNAVGGRRPATVSTFHPHTPEQKASQ